jgi:hypothetical protein
MQAVEHLNTLFYLIFTTRYVTTAAIALLFAGTVILTSSLSSQWDYVIRYQALEKAFLEYDPTTDSCVGYSCFSPSQPETLPYDSSIPWMIAIGASMLIGGSAAIFSIRPHQKQMPSSEMP